MPRREVEPGQKYRPTSGNALWQVVDLVQDGEGIAHARLIRLDDSTTTKMISVSALKDARLYRIVEE